MKRTFRAYAKLTALVLSADLFIWWFGEVVKGWAK
jgi:hypothetical protein